LSITSENITELLNSGNTVVNADNLDSVSALTQLAAAGLPIQLSTGEINGLMLKYVEDLHQKIYMDSLRPNYDRLLSSLKFRLSNLLLLSLPDPTLNTKLTKITNTIIDAKRIDDLDGNTLASLSRSFVYIFRSLESDEVELLLAVIQREGLMDIFRKVYLAENAIGNYAVEADREDNRVALEGGGESENMPTGEPEVSGLSDTGISSWDYLGVLPSVRAILEPAMMKIDNVCTDFDPVSLPSLDSEEKATGSIPQLLPYIDMLTLLEKGSDGLIERRMLQGFCLSDTLHMATANTYSSGLELARNILASGSHLQSSDGTVATNESYLRRQRVQGSIELAKFLGIEEELNTFMPSVLAEETTDAHSGVAVPANIYMPPNYSMLTSWQDLFIWYVEVMNELELGTDEMPNSTISSATSWLGTAMRLARGEEVSYEERQHIFYEVLIEAMTSESYTVQVGEYATAVDVSKVVWQLTARTKDGVTFIAVTPLTNPLYSYYYEDQLITSTTGIHTALAAEVDDNNINESYPYTPKGQVSGTVRIPILEYHRVEPVPNVASSTKALYVSPEVFEQQMAYLASNNYRTVLPLEFYSILQSGTNPTQKTVMITFDDGSRGQYEYAYPILKKYGLVAVFSINSGSKFLTDAELKTMSDNGMSIESHTVSHGDLSTSTDTGFLWYQTAGDKQNIEAITGKQVSAITYPFCVANGTAISIINGAGFNLGFTCGKGIDHTLRRRYVLERVFIFSDLENFKKRITGNWEVPAGYYVEY